MDVTASALTIFSSAWTLAVRVRHLIVHIKHHKENVQELENKVDTLAAIVEEVDKAYGPDKDGNQQIHRIVGGVRLRLEHDLESFREELSKVLDEREKGPLRPNWILRTWREEVAAPTFARLEKSMRSHQDSLQFLVNLLHGRRLDAGLAEVRASNERMLAVIHAFAPYTPPRRRNTEITLVASSGDTEIEQQAATASQDLPLLQHMFAQFLTAWLDQVAAGQRPSLSLEGTPHFGEDATTPWADSLTALRQTDGRSSSFSSHMTDTGNPPKPIRSRYSAVANDFAAAVPDLPPYLRSSSSREKVARAGSTTSQTASLTGVELTELWKARSGSSSEEIARVSISPSEPCDKGIDLLKVVQEDREDHADSLKVLIENNASLEERDVTKKRTPLLVAAASDKLHIVELLLSHGADAEATDGKGKTALHLACENAGLAVISSLLRAYRREDRADHSRVINVNATDTIGRTALHYCAQRDMVDAAKLLVDCDADIDIQDKGNYCPAYFAIKNRNYATMELLLERGALVDSKCRKLETSSEIKKLIQKISGNGDERQVFVSKVPRRKSTGTYLDTKISLLSLRRKSSAKT